MSAARDDRLEAIQMIRDSAAAVAPPGAGLQRIRDLRFTPLGYDPAILGQMGEMGWIGLRVPEAMGGAGLGLGEACALAEALGAALVPEPLLPAMLAVGVLAAAGIAPVLDGSALTLLAWQERADRLEVPGSPDAPRRFIPMAAGAGRFLVPVREGGRIALYAQDPAGLATEQTQDGGHFGTLAPNLGAAERVADDIGALLGPALDEAALLTGAYLLGGMDAAFAMTVEYLKTRSQFGRIIGSFQALQHKAADLRMQIALTRASLEAAAATLDAGATGDAARSAVSRAKARVAEASLLVTRQCIQLHGGIGYTDQYDVGLYLRKAMVLAGMYGGATLHRRRFMAVTPEGDE